MRDIVFSFTEFREPLAWLESPGNSCVAVY